MHLLKQSTAASVLVGPVLDSTGAVYTSAVIADFNLTKNGTSAAMAAAATATHDHNGHYVLALTTGNTDTAGRLTITCNKATYTMSKSAYEVLVAATFDAFITNAAGTANGLPLSGASNKVLVSTCDNLTTYTGNTPQTGDAYLRLGAPAGASTAADIAAVKSDTGTILTDVNTGAGAIYTRIGAPVGASISADVAALKTDLDAGVKLSVGTGAGQLNVASGKAPVTLASTDVTGNVPANTTQFGGQAVVLDGNNLPNVNTKDWNGTGIATSVPNPPTSAAIAAATAASILATPSQLLATDSTGRVSINPAQALAAPRDVSAVADGSMTINDAMWGAVLGAAARQDLVSNTITLATPATHTTYRISTVDSSSAPTFVH